MEFQTLLNECCKSFMWVALILTQAYNNKFIIKNTKKKNTYIEVGY